MVFCIEVVEKYRRGTKNGFLVTLGYILSPLSWWNDAFVNLPIAYAFAYLFRPLSESLFYPCLVVGYWSTNVLGFVLMHKGGSNLLSNKERGYTRKDLFKDFCISVVYTVIIAVLVAGSLLKMPT